MKQGTRGCGIAFSDGQHVSSCAAAVVRADRVVDGLRFGSCTVGGLDATATVVDALDALDRPDVQYLFVAGVAPAWFNLLDLHEIHETTDRPLLAVSFEASEGLEDAIRDHFSGDARDRRLAIYDSLPPRRTVRVGDDRLFVRALGFDAAGDGEEDAAGDGEEDAAGDGEEGAAGDGEEGAAGDGDGDAAGDGDVSAESVVRAFTPEGGRPEPLRVARLAARAARTASESADAFADDQERRG